MNLSKQNKGYNKVMQEEGIKLNINYIAIKFSLQKYLSKIINGDKWLTIIYCNVEKLYGYLSQDLIRLEYVMSPQYYRK